MSQTEAATITESCEPYLVGSDLPPGRARDLAGELIRRYDESWRRYHTARHLSDMVGFIIENVDALKNPRTVLWAALGHDSIYVPANTGGMNEAMSAQLAAGMLRPSLPSSEAAGVDGYIRATADHGWDGEDMDLAYFLDADMKILGAPRDEFDEYDANIFEEYRGVYDEISYRAGRIQVLSGFLTRSKLSGLFITDIAHERFEAQTRENLERKIDELSSAS